jgi:Protein of unknown function (DUF1064).
MRKPFRLHHKYNAKQTECDGITFSSKKEAGYYCKLKALKTSGTVLFFLRQVPFHLPGGVRFVIDFVEFWENGDVRFVDTKGFKTESYKAKKRMVESLYSPVEIEEE